MSAETRTERHRFSEAFIARLERLVKEGDRGALATLRRGLGKEIPFEAYRFMPFSPAEWQERAALLVGPLFALWHQGKDELGKTQEDEDLGDSMLQLVNAMVRKGTERDRAMKSVERRFSALLNCHVDDLKPHLRHAVSLLRSYEVPVNWRLLMRHVQHWSHENHWVQHEWARSFWAPRTGPGEQSDDVQAPEMPVEVDVDYSAE